MSIVRAVKELIGIPVQPWTAWRVEVFWAYWGKEPAFAVARFGDEWPPQGKFQREVLKERSGLWGKRLVLVQTHADAQAKADELNVGYVAREPDLEELPF